MSGHLEKLKGAEEAISKSTCHSNSLFPPPKTGTDKSLPLMLTALPIPDDSQREHGANKLLICSLI